MVLTPIQTDGLADSVPAAARAALVLLLEAYEYAQGLAAPIWDFALGLPCLRAAGIGESALRWLICAGYIDHAVETSRPRSKQRTFHKVSNLALTDGTCFVLTPSGTSASRRPCAHATQLDGNRMPVDGQKPAPQEVPRWDPELRELRLGDSLVKQFKQPAPHQETILAGFQEEGWPPRIDDPLSPEPGQDEKQRFHSVINRLNGHQKNRLIRFLADGTGQGVRWERML